MYDSFTSHYLISADTNSTFIINNTSDQMFLRSHKETKLSISKYRYDNKFLIM